jgi:Tetratricopeptide repeat
VLAIRENALAPTIPMSLNTLALLHYDQGRYDNTEPLYKRALTIPEKALGPDNPWLDGGGRSENKTGRSRATSGDATRQAKLI